MERVLKCEPGAYMLTGSDAFLNRRYNMVIQYLKSMKLLLTEGYQIEQSHLGEPFGEFFTDISAYISTTIILAGSMLEANIYERFVDVKDGFLDISNFNLSKLNADWEDIKKCSSILGKYIKFASLSDKDLDNTDVKYREIKNLVQIRNALVHYMPQWDYEKTPSEKIEKCISQISSSVDYSPFIPSTEPYFPHRCMSASFGQWAINASLDFIKHFEDSILIDNKCEPLRNELQIVHP